MTLLAGVWELGVEVSFGLLLVAAFLAFARIARGPSLADRVVALDQLSVTLVAISAVYAVLTGEMAFLDVSLGLALVAFFTTVAFARYIQQRAEDGGVGCGEEEEPR